MKSKKSIILHEPQTGSNKIGEVQKYSEKIKDLGYGMHWVTDKRGALYSMEMEGGSIACAITGLDKWMKEKKIHGGVDFAKAVHDYATAILAVKRIKKEKINAVSNMYSGKDLDYLKLGIENKYHGHIKEILDGFGIADMKKKNGGSELESNLKDYLPIILVTTPQKINEIPREYVAEQMRYFAGPPIRNAKDFKKNMKVYL